MSLSLTARLTHTHCFSMSLSLFLSFSFSPSLLFLFVQWCEVVSFTCFASVCIFSSLNFINISISDSLTFSLCVGASVSQSFLKSVDLFMSSCSVCVCLCICECPSFWLYLYSNVLGDVFPTLFFVYFSLFLCSDECVCMHVCVSAPLLHALSPFPSLSILPISHTTLTFLQLFVPRHIFFDHFKNWLPGKNDLSELILRNLNSCKCFSEFTSRRCHALNRFLTNRILFPQIIF